MFNEKYNNSIEMFDLTHILTLVFMTLVIITLCIFKNHFKKKKNDRIFRYSLASFLLVMEIGWHIWNITLNTYTIDLMPITGLCAIINLLTIIALYTNNRKLISIIFYWAHVGAFFSLVFIDMAYTIPHFRYFHYFFVHFGFLLGNLYYYLTDRLILTRKYINISCIIILSIVLIALPFNLIFDKNYFYLLESPVKEVSDFFGLPWYTICWIIAIGLMLNGIYYMYRGINKLRKINNN